MLRIPTVAMVALLAAIPTAAAVVDFTGMAGQQMFSFSQSGANFSPTPSDILTFTDDRICGESFKGGCQGLTVQFDAPVTDFQVTAYDDFSMIPGSFLLLRGGAYYFNAPLIGDGNPLTPEFYDFSGYGAFDSVTFFTAQRFDDFSFTTAGVPEPASWAMLMAGFGLVGAIARRRKRATA